MDIIYHWIKYSHVLAGALSLVLFWIPAFAKKGSKLHNKAGIVYVVTMAYVVVTAYVLCAFMWEKLHFLAIMLLFLGMVTTNPILHGYIYIKKKHLPENWRKFSLVFNLLMTALGGYLLYLGVAKGEVMGCVFGGIAILAGLANVKNFSKKKDTHVLNAHLTNMIFSGSAAYTAFLAFGARSYLYEWLGSSWLGIIPWILPTFIAMVVVRVLRSKYGKVKTV